MLKDIIKDYFKATSLLPFPSTPTLTVSKETWCKAQAMEKSIVTEDKRNNKSISRILLFLKSLLK